MIGTQLRELTLRHYRNAAVENRGNATGLNIVVELDGAAPQGLDHHRGIPQYVSSLIEKGSSNGGSPAGTGVQHRKIGLETSVAF